MSYCTACGQPRGGPAPFCTTCGAPFAGPGEPGGAPAGSPGPGEPGGPPPDDDFFNSLFRPDPAPAGPDQTRQIPAVSAAGPDRIEPWPPPGRRQGGASRRIVMAVGVLILLAAAGTGAWLVFGHPHTSGPASAGGGTPTRGTSGSPSTAKATPTSSPRANAGGLVAVAPGVSRQAPEPRVVAYLDDYFTAINRHSYRRFSVLLGPQMRQTLPAPAFYAGYRTTTDSAARLTSLSAGGGGQVQADVAFTSHQAPGVSPSHSGCTRWSIVLVLAPQHGRLVLEPPPPGYHASYQAC
jgi:hypothetical protein